ncbi:MAG: 30S ribosome-binding factor RbfA [Bacilli bacterium]|nr:30S ribosome-binding factor RbfA [Bacilli bacterium]
MNDIKLKRINSEIQKCISQIIFEEARDSILKDITITYCDTTNDLSFCKVYFTSLIEKDHKEFEKELNDDTAKFLRVKLADAIDLRNIPELIFKYDESIEYGNNIERIIASLHEENK